jgi:hypothetical protein
MKVLFTALAAVATLAFAGSALGDTFITDTLAPGGKAPALQGYRFVTDTLAPGGGTTEVVVQPSSNFNWSDAGVGAGVAAGTIIVLLGSTLIVTRRPGRLAV